MKGLSVASPQLLPTRIARSPFFKTQEKSAMSDEDTYEIPLQDQRVFGAGIKRQRVRFVPSSSSSSNEPASASTPAKSVSDLYLSLVLPQATPSSEIRAQPVLPAPSPSSLAKAGLPTPCSMETSAPEICGICRLPLESTDPTTTSIPKETIPECADVEVQLSLPKYRPHEASLAHQVCLQHSHPPSHLDRNRKGLAYLSAYGWDPDARRGLGAEGQGIQFPIKTKSKDDKLGIGVVPPKPGEIRKNERPQMLDAGKVRKLQERDRRKGEKLRDMFYRSEDVERYLGRN